MDVVNKAEGDPDHRGEGVREHNDSDWKGEAEEAEMDRRIVRRRSSVYGSSTKTRTRPLPQPFMSA